MTGSADPSVHRLALWRRLRGMRFETRVSQEQVAQLLGWELADLLLVEAVADGIDDGRLLTLLNHYGIADDVRDLYQSVQAPHPRGILPSKEVRVLLEYEKAASVISTFEPFVIPGL